MAGNLWRSVIDPAKMKSARSDGFFASLVMGFSVTLGNPKTIIFYMALLPGVVDISSISAQDYGVLAVLTVLVIYTVLTPYILLASKARAFLSNPRSLRILNRSAATAMAGAAAFIVLKD
jgi:threonine/homoserine/homoserine lactone efflux protein